MPACKKIGFSNNNYNKAIKTIDAYSFEKRTEKEF